MTAPNPNNSTTILLQLTAVGPTDGSDFWTGIGYSPTGEMVNELFDCHSIKSICCRKKALLH
jgi:hypothetical protein